MFTLRVLFNLGTFVGIARKHFYGTSAFVQHAGTAHGIIFIVRDNTRVFKKVLKHAHRTILHTGMIVFKVP